MESVQDTTPDDKDDNAPRPREPNTQHPTSQFWVEIPVWRGYDLQQIASHKSDAIDASEPSEVEVARKRKRGQRKRVRKALYQEKVKAATRAEHTRFRDQRTQASKEKIRLMQEELDVNEHIIRSADVVAQVARARWLAVDARLRGLEVQLAMEEEF